MPSLDLERIAKVIKSVSPDIVSLQEVDNKVKRRNNVDQAKELSRLVKMDYIFGRSIDYGGGQYGNTVLTKLPIRKSEVLSLPGRKKRSTLCVTLKTAKNDSAGMFVFIATHFDLSEEMRIASVPLINKLFDADKELPAILAGDLNAKPGSPAMKNFEKNWENATFQKSRVTCPAKNPGVQIDYILYRRSLNFTFFETSVLQENTASDHRPVLAVLQFNP